jgi:hypothetical protein
MAALVYVPLGQVVQTAALVAAGVALALPASHCKAEVRERQVVFALASPPPHLTCSQLAAPTVLMYDPAAQLVQAATPLVPLYLPATHSSHPLSSAFGCFPSSQTEQPGVQKLALPVLLASATVSPASSWMFHDVSSG